MMERLLKCGSFYEVQSNVKISCAEELLRLINVTQTNMTPLHKLYFMYCSFKGTIALEFLDQVPDLDTILVPTSGGGMVSGIAIAAKSIKPDIKGKHFTL